MSYEPSLIEPKWQKHWDDNQVFRSTVDRNKPKYYVLDMFPYPSGSGLHVGHPEGYTATDILARYHRAKGFNVLHPMGWDAFGLPAEQNAIQTGTHPAITTRQAIKNFKRQLKMLGFSYDWEREISTCEPDYYKWTQWIFKRLHEKGLAYQTEVPVNWCPVLKTVLANEEVVDGKSERGGHPVFRVPMKQWMLRITDYAERLLQDLEKIDWPEGTKELQRNWIGKSTGLQLRFEIEDSKESVEVYTTRPDTLFGVTFLAIAPESALASTLTKKSHSVEVEKYKKESSQRSEMARQDQTREKTGVFSGSFAIHPYTKKPIPIWIADYVLMNYGTGAVMGVPAHDERDEEFAKTYDLPNIAVIDEKGITIESGAFSGMPHREANEAIIKDCEKRGFGKSSIQYKLRDWLFSRQRYWGEPFPVIHFKDRSELVADKDLPVALPEVKSYEPTGTGESPLAQIHEWVKTHTLQGEEARRETDTMPGSAGSSWYFLRYCDPKNTEEPFSKEAVDYWMPVDLYLGGPEHAVGHLLYARFWTKVLYDCGVLSFDEPFKRLVHQGMILGEDGEKMSKSKGNVVNPDDVVSKYGADTLRIYEMFMGPLSQDKPWSTNAIEGCFRFLQRFSRLFESLDPTSEMTEEDHKVVHKTIDKVTQDIEGIRFNTAISQMMIFTNHFTQKAKRPIKALAPAVQLLQPFAPHLAEELWRVIGETSELSYAPWPKADPKWLTDDMVTLAVQVMGKTRATISVPRNATEAEVRKLAETQTAVQNQITDKTIQRCVFVPNKILNYILKM